MHKTLSLGYEGRNRKIANKQLKMGVIHQALQYTIYG